jgi:hypothetical protein
MTSPTALRVATLPVLLAGFAGCIATASDSPLEDEPLTEQALPLVRPFSAEASCATETKCGEDADAQENLARLARIIPPWKIYIKGTDLHRSARRWEYGKLVYWDDPMASDSSGQLVAVRSGEENQRSKWVYLSSRLHWQLGDRYFQDLIDAGTVTPLDLLVIRALVDDLAKKKEEPPSVFSLPGAAEPRIGRAELPGSNPYPLPDWGTPGGDHTGPAPTPRTPPPGSPSHNPPPGGGRGGHGGGVHVPVVPPPGSEHHPGTPPAGGRVSHEDAMNGIVPGDPPAIPSPFDAGYSPAPNERQEHYKCNGTVYAGYKKACVDFSPIPVTQKWGTKLDLWSTSYFAEGGKSTGMSLDDWTKVCELLDAVAFGGNCLALTLSCTGSAVVTFGSTAIPCAVLVPVVCFSLGAATTFVGAHCKELMSLH